MLAAQFNKDSMFEDASYLSPIQGREDIERHFRLVADSTNCKVVVVDDIATDKSDSKISVLYHFETTTDNQAVPNSRHLAFFTLDSSGLIESVFDTVEPVFKAGPANLKVLSVASKILETPQGDTSTTRRSKTKNSIASLTAPGRYFAAWNRRDMDEAANLFTEDCRYEDTVFPQVFDSKSQLQNHLKLCSDSMPPGFRFIVDDIADGGSKLGVRWHVENNGEKLPFTRGSSFYSVDSKTGLIGSGLDEIEPAVLKLGPFKLLFNTLKTKLLQEPIRAAPLLVWLAYMYIVFFSDGILPGANALQFETRTWEEVKNLSLNFFLVAPLLNLPFSPTVHPVLEGVFNLLLSWAALFAGFFSDERKDKPNIFPVLPTVAGMQFLTSAFLLPYLTLRSSETRTEKLAFSELSCPAKVAESKLLGPSLGLVGTGAFVWAVLARFSEFGGVGERMDSFWRLMSIDRVGSSFLVDLAIFAVFQGWLVDDDLQRRGVPQEEMKALRLTAKFVPFFGLAAYLTLRPGFKTDEA
jgi:hypothetical protein